MFDAVGGDLWRARLDGSRARSEEDGVAYDKDLAQRVRTALGARPGLVEKAMFGGIGFILRGNMACGVHKDALIIRVGPERYHDALERPHARSFDMTGRPMRGWVMVGPGKYEADDDLGAWVQQGIEFALSLPPK